LGRNAQKQKTILFPVVTLVVDMCVKAL